MRAEHGEPINVTGQETIYDSNTDTFVVKGDAVMTQGGSVLKADEIDVMRRERDSDRDRPRASDRSRSRNVGDQGENQHHGRNP